MERQKIFSTNIFIKDEFLDPHRLPAMQEEIEKLYKQRTYNDNWQTSPDLDKEDPSGAFKWFAKDISKAAFNIFDTLDYNVDEIEITGMWANYLYKGDAHPPHTHSNNFLSGVYYLEVEDGAAPIQFFDPRPQANVLRPRNKANWQNCSMIQFDAIKGVGYIFPSWLQHWVPPTKGERISISWNIILRGEYGEPGTLQNAYI